MKQQSGFKKGNREATKRKRRGGGRPTNRELGIREEVKRLVELELQKHVMAVIGAGRKIATGVKRRKHNPKTGDVYFEIEFDGAMIRHWIDKFVPDASKTLDINVDGPEEFWRALAAARATPQQKPAPMGLISEKGALQR